MSVELAGEGGLPRITEKLTDLSKQGKMDEVFASTNCIVYPKQKPYHKTKRDGTMQMQSSISFFYYLNLSR